MTPEQSASGEANSGAASGERTADLIALADALRESLTARDGAIAWAGPYDHGEPPTVEQIVSSLLPRLGQKGYKVVPVAAPPDAPSDGATPSSPQGDLRAALEHLLFKVNPSDYEDWYNLGVRDALDAALAAAPVAEGQGLTIEIIQEADVHCATCPPCGSDCAESVIESLRDALAATGPYTHPAWDATLERIR